MTYEDDIAVDDAWKEFHGQSRGGTLKDYYLQVFPRAEINPHPKIVLGSIPLLKTTTAYHREYNQRLFKKERLPKTSGMHLIKPISERESISKRYLGGFTGMWTYSHDGIESAWVNGPIDNKYPGSLDTCARANRSNLDEVAYRLWETISETQKIPEYYTLTQNSYIHASVRMTKLPMPLDSWPWLPLGIQLCQSMALYCINLFGEDKR